MSRPAPVRLLLVDDHPASREPLAMLLDRQPDLQVVGQAGSLAEARRAIAAGMTVDIALVDLDLGDGSGADLIRDLRIANPEAQALVLTGLRGEGILGRAIAEGASGIVSKTASTADLVAAIRRLAAGETLMAPAEAAALVARGARYQRRDDAERAALERLSPREREVLRLLAAGLSNEAIAEQLSVGIETVRSHVVRILHKLGASSRLQAAVIAIRQGYADDDSV